MRNPFGLSNTSEQTLREQFHKPLADFVESALSVSERAERVGETAAGLWPQVRGIMQAAIDAKVEYETWASVVREETRALDDASATVKAYVSTLINAPAAWQSGAGEQALKALKVEKPLPELGFNTVRNVIKEARKVVKATANPDAPKFEATLAELTKRLRNLVKTRRANAEKGITALRAMSYSDALEIVAGMLAQVPEREEIKEDQPSTLEHAANAPQPARRAAA